MACLTLARKVSGICVALLLIVEAVRSQDSMGFRDPSIPLKQRVKTLLSLLTRGEKINLLGYRNREIPSLGIPACNWWNEGLHGDSRAGEATVFPQAIGMAASPMTACYNGAHRIQTHPRQV